MSRSIDRLSGGTDSVLPGSEPGFLRAIPRFLQFLWVRLAATDPGLLRLLLAVRGTLAAAITGIALFFIASTAGLPFMDFGFGIVLSMTGPFVARDTMPKQRWISLLILLPPAVIAETVTTFIHDYPLLGEAWFLLLLFSANLLQTRNPRALSVGMISVMMTYVGLYLRLSVSTLPLQYAALLVATAACWIVCFLLFPIRPLATLRLAERSVRRRAGRILRDARRLGKPKRAATLRRHLKRLNEASLAAEDQLAVLDEPRRLDIRLHLFELEQAVVRLFALISAGGLEERHWARLQVAGERMHLGRSLRPVRPSGTASDPMQEALLALNRASLGLEIAASRVMAAESHPVAAPPTPPGPLAWRNALQVTLAAALAMTGGMMLSPQRWFWAVVAVYVVLLNARTRGDALYKGSHRVVGTLCGLFGGLLISIAIGGNGVATGILILLAVFGSYYFYAVSYSIAVFCITIMLGMIYGVFGTPLEPLLVLRLEETAIGVFSAAFAAVFVWPIPIRHQIRLSGHAVLRALRDVVRASLATMTGGASPSSPNLAPIEAVRQLDRQLADLRLALLPLTAGRFIMRSARLDRPMTALLACARSARALASAVREEIEPDPEALRQQGDRIEARITVMLEGTPMPASNGNDESADSKAGQALRQLELALDMLSERLETNLIDGFTVD